MTKGGWRVRSPRTLRRLATTAVELYWRVVDADPTWPFERYQAYEDVRFQQSLAEQEQARSSGLVADPKSQPHGGYRIACEWPEEVTAAACALSARLAELLPETPAYPYQALHSSIGNIAAPDARLVDPDRNADDRRLLDCLADAASAALKTAADSAVERVALVRRCWLREWPWCSGGPRRAIGRCTALSTVPVRSGRWSWCRAGGRT